MPEPNLKLAALDIGSNAARMQICTANEFRGDVTFKKLEYVRYPLRLGMDVFNEGTIGPERQEKTMQFLRVCANLLVLHEIAPEQYLGYATSAMREAANGAEVVERARAETGLDIEIIDGQREAEVTNDAFFKTLDQKAYIHIDVGGGSTELNLYFGQQKIASESFRVGTVRQLKKSESRRVWDSIQQWVKRHLDKGYRPMTAIGTGGNINKIFDLVENQRKIKNPALHIDEVIETRNYLASLTLDERINGLLLNPDRADVIVPASEIYLTVMKFARAKKIVVPDVGLKDGMIRLLYERQRAVVK